VRVLEHAQELYFAPYLLHHVQRHYLSAVEDFDTHLDPRRLVCRHWGGPRPPAEWSAGRVRPRPRQAQRTRRTLDFAKGAHAECLAEHVRPYLETPGHSHEHAGWGAAGAGAVRSLFPFAATLMMS
jgi:hypothetical protein